MIPMSPDVRQLVGDWAEKVDNRSLLYEKFALPKVWGAGDSQKVDDAGRWNVLRIVTRGQELLSQDAARLRREAGGKNVKPHVRERKLRDAQIAEHMSKVATFDPEFIQKANSKAIRFLDDLNKALGGRVVTFEATLGARLMINLAGGVVENAGIALDRCFGLPFIPGSAVKGIARNQALWEIYSAQGNEKSGLLKMAMLVFGYGANDIKKKGDFGWAGGSDMAQNIAKEIGATDFKGCACFLPAYPTTPPKLIVDIVNPHYPEYYRGKQTHAEDNENPVPNYFPAVEAGSSFGFAVLINRIPLLAGCDAEVLLGQAKVWIERAITRRGIGAKVAAGYGWFELGRIPQKSSQRQGISQSSAQPQGTSSSSSLADEIIRKWMGHLNTPDNFRVALPEIAKLDNDAELKRVFEAVIPEQHLKKNKKHNPYWQSFTSGKHGEAGKQILSRLGFKLE